MHTATNSISSLSAANHAEEPSASTIDPRLAIDAQRLENGLPGGERQICQHHLLAQGK
jgi:hypothetical protein